MMTRKRVVGRCLDCPTRVDPRAVRCRRCYFVFIKAKSERDFEKRPRICRVCKIAPLSPGHRRARKYVCAPCVYEMYGRFSPSRDRVVHRFQMRSWKRLRRIRENAF